MSRQCPRCEQGAVLAMKINSRSINLWVCEECEATWFSVRDIGNERFYDLGTELEALGLPPLWSELVSQHTVV